MPTRVLTSEQVEELVEPEGLLASLDQAHRWLAAGLAAQPAPHAFRAPGDRTADGPAVVPMASFAPGLGLFAVKVLADRPRDRGLGLPAQRSTISVYSAETGECVGLLDGRAVTRLRTAAVTALATRTLARPGARRVALLGAGALAREHAHALAHVLDLDEVRVWSRSPERGLALAESLTAAGLPAVATVDARAAVAGADVVCTLTPAEAPVLRADWLSPGTHVNAVGSPPRPEFSEVPPEVFARAAVTVVDARVVALADSGNVRNAIAAGALTAGDLVELGEVLVGDAAGRTDAADLTVFNSVGIGLQDLAAADHVLRRAADAEAGTMVRTRA
ncbi:ornithine cyclodeaminase family protein [Promicromonospora sukumoe]|uniref:Ornithine cyclodeaminase/alanine dehydrogenase-like protein (Mu-crystallin family) n=1 Tax=Promicromonospora sukumoe TaxID=88382 RepID=A0A7W3J911_9MICO|nr:ornithine cyclodeaminase family protein [Promicromonospora sukumoe]MBA8808490.1 ornithine cyclodeaminase/alanine dehydrogenase-like protein (mu-crystallin family) [Promicromonospora sukumoe]